jgi:hypothetical protein
VTYQQPTYQQPMPQPPQPPQPPAQQQQPMPQQQPQPQQQPPMPQPQAQPVPQFVAPAPPPMSPMPQPPQFVVPQPPPAAPQQQAPAAPQQQVAATQIPPAPAGGPSQQGQPATGEHGFPPNTPWRDMSTEQQVAYWQHQAKRHEQRVKEMSDYDQLRATAEQYQQMVASQQSEHQRAVADAHRQGREQALAEAGSHLVDQWVRAAAVGRLPQESVNALLAGLDRKAFLNAQNGVDTDRVYQFVSSLVPQPAPVVPVPAQAPGQPGQSPPLAPQPTQPQAPQPTAPPRGPDFGQGQPGGPKPGGLAAGREIARQRFGTPSTPPTQPAQ